MKVLSTEGLTKLIQLTKSGFISVNDTVSANTVTLATVATSGSYNDLTNKPTIPDVSNLANKDLSNVPTSKGILTESYINGLSGYNVYANGLCEQWGYVATNGVAGLSTVTFLKAYGDTNYNILTCPQRGDINYAPVAIPLIINTDSMQIGSTLYTGGYYWRTIGYMS